MKVLEDLRQELHLRREGEFDQSNQILSRLADEESDQPSIQYQAAWSFDILGREETAVTYYEKAIETGLEGEELEDAYVALGNTYRNLGHYQAASQTLEQGMKQFPHNRAMQVFYSMTLYNLGNHDNAMTLLLQNLTATSNDPNIMAFHKAINFYSDKLDEVW
ncbi:tetratricopeptide repeat protein [Thalassobacillus sp. CUG 92003]|uniref:tetratricopeptide repeat protein n=1 Tax=Thalassobacillus sp. CUG 92003 TaxID=2736641 RepID=UPI001C633B31|nr:tetratricopeptide repeat protein [Thalassobacillus sp. CUG 92003]